MTYPRSAAQPHSPVFRVALAALSTCSLPACANLTATQREVLVVTSGIVVLGIVAANSGRDGDGPAEDCRFRGACDLPPR